MLQVGFGFTPLHSGLLTFATAAGALLMKTTAAPILRRFGFRRVLIWNGLVSAAFMVTFCLFRVETPTVVILVLLLSGGFFRSLEFTSLNTISYAEVKRERMSRATSFASMAQQLSMSVGVGAGALILHAMLTITGGTALTADDFTPAFLIIAALSAASVLWFRPLAADAGSELSGARSRVAAAAPAPQPGPPA
jgi:MFS family permease